MRATLPRSHSGQVREHVDRRHRTLAPVWIAAFELLPQLVIAPELIANALSDLRFARWLSRSWRKERGPDPLRRRARCAPILFGPRFVAVAAVGQFVGRAFLTGM